jgi:hypothetical protein
MLSHERMVLSFTIATGLRQCSPRPAVLDHIVLSQLRDSPNLEGQVSIFVSLRKRMGQLYPESLGSLFVASYDSQGYGVGIRTRLHARLKD